MKTRSLHHNIKSYEHIASIEAPLSITTEGFRKAKVGIDFALIDNPNKVIAVCSSLKGEGKTTALANLAACFSQSNKKVIAIDLDLRRPMLYRVANIENKDGVSDVLAGNVKLEAAIKKNDNLPFDMLNSGTTVPYPVAILESKELKDLIAKLKEMYDVVLVDCPPVLAVSDAVIISSLVDGVVFVVSQQVSEKQASKRAIKVLKNCKANILGAILTEFEMKSSGDGYDNSYYYSYYGK